MQVSSPTFGGEGFLRLVVRDSYVWSVFTFRGK